MAYGIGVVILYRMPDGTERPLVFASCTMTKSEKNYAQLEKESLSLVYKDKKFLDIFKVGNLLYS